MRPRSLKLEGFTCYRAAAEIAFDGMDVFVISGPTGAGKSTIIDAICYALYGRVPRQTDAMALITPGAPRMSVQLAFDAAGKTYRVHRGINVSEKGKRAHSPVQFEQLGGDGEWVPLAGRVKEIDAQVEALVGLDFKGFQRCVLLPQGQFQEFLAGDRDERRKILEHLLDLGVYERIMRAANARNNEMQTQIAERERQLRDDYADATEEALAALRAHVEELRPALTQARQQDEAVAQASLHAHSAKEARKRARQKQDELAAGEKKLAVAERLAKDGDAQLRTLDAAIGEAERQLERIGYDPALHNRLRTARQAAAVAAQARAELERARSAADEGRVARALQVSAAADAAHAAATSALAEADAALDAARRADAAAHLQSGLKPGDPCPVCGGAIGKLPKAARSTLATAQSAGERAKVAEAKSAAEARKAAQSLAAEQQRYASALEDVARCTASLTTAEGDLGAALPPGLEPELKAISAALAAHDKAAAARDELSAELTKRRAERQATADGIASSARDLAGLRASLAQLEAGAKQDDAEARENIASLRLLAEKWEWADVLASITAARDPSESLANKVRFARAEVDSITASIAKGESRIEEAERKIERAAELRSELEAITQRARVYHELGQLLKADNFRQYILDEAMELLAESATAHLRTLHERFAITVEKGEFKVIDHWQADSVRPARTLSGGETFVASLALALALSERLPELQSSATARARGAALESLFLDEGFGTLDPDTLNTVIEALEGLRSEERMVGVITHVKELAERIECRIEVVPSPEGSTVVVHGAPA